MGHVRHHAIVVTSYDYDALLAAHREAPDPKTPMGDDEERNDG